MAQKRGLYNPLHPFHDDPFEVYYQGSWQAVERIRINSGSLVLHLVDVGYVSEEKSFLSTLRLRPRRASLSDCTCFLRSGVDICVLSTSRETENSSKETQPPVWNEARLVSIERKPHDTKCACKFFVKLNDIEDHGGVLKGNLSKEVTEVGINQISIFQKFERKPADHTKHYRWLASEDCTSVLNTRVNLGKFQSDIAWMVVTSIHKQIGFDIRSIENRIVYQILDASYDSFADVNLSAINFKVDGEQTVPVVVPFEVFHPIESCRGVEVEDEEEEAEAFLSYEFREVRRSKRRNVKPDRYLGDIGLEEQDITSLRIGWKSSKPNDDEEEEEMPIFLLSCETSSTESSEDEDEQSLRYEIRESDDYRVPKRTRDAKGKKVSVLDRTRKMKKPSSSKVRSKGAKEQRENHDDHHLAIIPFEQGNNKMTNDVPLEYPKRRPKGGRVARSRNLAENDSQEDDDDWDKKVSRANYKRRDRKSNRTYGRKYRSSVSCSRKDHYPGPSTSSGLGKKKTLDSDAYKELISAYMRNVKLTIEKKLPEVTDPFEELLRQRGSNENQHISDEDEEDTEKEEAKEETELDMLWKECELGLPSLYYGEDEIFEEDKKAESSEAGGKPCKHMLEEDDEIGILCSLCGYVVAESRDITPEFLQSSGWSYKRDRRQGRQDKDDFEHKVIDEVNCKPSSSSEAPATNEEVESVWGLIPNMGSKLHPHQRKAFEFLWRNIAGSLIPSEMESEKEKIGGCVISHTPGAGKTFLIIAFLVSYLKLFPGKRPLILVPKTTLYTWHKEINKWEFPFPVHQIHGRRTFRSRIHTREIEGNPSGDVLHVLDCLEKLQKWHAHPSVLLMGYTSFMTMMRKDSKYEHRTYMGQLLRESPGILILDEGHNPRSTKSRLRKALMRVDTKVRILLSGTLFQNNFGEYFNTLALARPKFVHKVLDELDPKYQRKIAGLEKTRTTIENRARKVFMDVIAGKIDSTDLDERKEGLDELKSMTNNFIDIYEGGSFENLPGLQSYTLMMKPTRIQHKILIKLHKLMNAYRGYPLEIELLITLGSIHPWLIKTATCASKFMTKEELDALEEHKMDPTKGSKVKFVLELAYRCSLRKEKVLIFCHNLAPINLFLDLFSTLFEWTKGEEVLVLSGELELFERGRIIDKFEERANPSKVMLASINACAEGISLTAASRVILLDSEWNPSKQKQAIARAFRPGQEKMVYVYHLLAKETLEQDKYERTTWKEWVSSMIFSEEAVEDPSRWQAEKIEDALLREIVEDDPVKLFSMIVKNEKASFENPLKPNE